MLAHECQSVVVAGVLEDILSLVSMLAPRRSISQICFNTFALQLKRPHTQQQFSTPVRTMSVKSQGEAKEKTLIVGKYQIVVPYDGNAEDDFVK